MRLVLRSLPAFALALGAASSPLAAQVATPKNDTYRFWLGAQGGVTVFSTPGQSRGGIPTAGGNLLIKAKRTGLLITVAEGIGSNEQTAYTRPTLGTSQTLLFNDLRTFAFHLVAFPVRAAAQPYFGVGAGIVNVVNPRPINATALTPQDISDIRDETQNLGSNAFFSAIGGVNFNVGRLTAFGQYTYTSSAPSGKLLRGPTHTMVGGLRFNLGRSRESLTSGGY